MEESEWVGHSRREKSFLAKPSPLPPRWPSSRRTVLVGLLGMIGGGIIGSVIGLAVGEQRSSASLPASVGNPGSPPLYFTEVVTFLGDFGESEPANPKGLAYHPTLKKILVTLSPYHVPKGQRVQILNAIVSDGTRSAFAPDYTGQGQDLSFVW